MVGKRAESEPRRSYGKMMDGRQWTSKQASKQKAETRERPRRKAGMTGQEGRTQPERGSASKWVTWGV